MPCNWPRPRYWCPDGAVNFVTLAGDLRQTDGTLVVGPRQGASGLISRRSQLRELNEQLADLDARITAAEAAVNEVQAQIMQRQEAVGHHAAAHRQASGGLGRPSPEADGCRGAAGPVQSAAGGAGRRIPGRVGAARCGRGTAGRSPRETPAKRDRPVRDGSPPGRLPAAGRPLGRRAAGPQSRNDGNQGRAGQERGAPAEPALAAAAVRRNPPGTRPRDRRGPPAIGALHPAGRGLALEHPAGRVGACRLVSSQGSLCRRDRPLHATSAKPSSSSATN